MTDLSAPEFHDLDHFHDGEYDDLPDRPDLEPVEVRRNGLLAAAVGVVAAVVALAYLTRALGGGSWLDWTLAGLMGLIGAAYLSAFVDSRVPLLVADTHGVRLRLGRTWRGVPWSELDCVEHEPRRGLLRDGHLVLVADHPDSLLADLDRAGRRQVALAQRLHGSPVAIPLGLSTSVVGAGDDLTAALVELAGDPDRVVEIVEEEILDEQPVEAMVDWPEDSTQPLDEDWIPEQEPLAATPPILPDPRPRLARTIDRIAGLLRRPDRDDRTEADGRTEADDQTVDDLEPVDVDGNDVPAPATAAHEPELTVPIALSEIDLGNLDLDASPTPLPLREPITGVRSEIRFDDAAALQVDPTEDPEETQALPEVGELRRSPDRWSAEPLLIDGYADAPAREELDVPSAEPVVGPQLAAAREQLHLSVDQLAERTRIRPHVIESIEVDDFAPCGGDFYARGHLRTLARVLGVDAAPLLAEYDQRHAAAPIAARQVFEAELATGADGPIRGTRGGPNWSVLVAAVMALVLAWSIARLIMDSPVSLDSKPVLNGSPSQTTKLGPAVPVLLDAAEGGAHVVVRDGAGEVVFNGDLSFGQKKQLKATPPVQIQSSDGGLVTTVDGEPRGPLGGSGQPASATYAAAS